MGRLIMLTASRLEILSHPILISSGETNDPKPCEVPSPIVLGVEQRDGLAEALHTAARAQVVNEDRTIERKKKVCVESIVDRASLLRWTIHYS